MNTPEQNEGDRKRFVCIHGHFYQPPRENPWLEDNEVRTRCPVPRLESADLR